MKKVFLILIQNRICLPSGSVQVGDLISSSRLRIKALDVREATEEAYRCISPDLIESMIVVELEKSSKR